MEFQAGIQVSMDGPLAPFADDLRRELAGSGYSPRSAGELMRLAAQLSRWLDSRSLTAEDLTAAVAGEFVQARRAGGCRRRLTSRSLAPLLKCLQIAPADTVSGMPVEGLLAQYRDYLRSERGLADSTVSQYLRHAAVFISRPPAGSALAGLTAGQITAFVMAWCRQRNASQARMMVTALRSLLRFLHVSGHLTTSLAGAVPSVPGWRKVRVPQPVHAGQIAAVLAGCDRRSALGRRDYAVILLMARLGLRAGEVAAMQITDADWQTGQLTVRGKGNRLDALPLPADVGEALADYLQHGRRRAPASASLFLRAVAPSGPIRAGTITGLVHRACTRAEVSPFGPHRLRHAVACSLLAEGASLEEIGQLLRHSGQSTTSQYARVDLARLRELAMPCPIGAVR